MRLMRAGNLRPPATEKTAATDTALQDIATTTKTCITTYGEGGESGDEGEVESGVEDIGLQTKFNHKEGKSSKPQNLDLQPAIYID
jgi:hypothetical protein